MSKVGVASLELLKKSGCDIVMAPKMGPLSAKELEEALPGFDAVLASVDQFTKAVLKSQAASKLKLISRWGVGYDSIDVKAATDEGIVVAYVPSLLNNAVADYSFALLCAVARHVHEGHLQMTRGIWRQTWGHDIYGKTLGIVGYGRIGQAVAKRAQGFDMKVIAHDPGATADAAKSNVKLVTLNTLCKEADFISIHVPLTEKTRGMIGEAQLKLMKPTAYLINTSRGPVIDEPALARSLLQEGLAGAALDVFAVEPLAPDHIFHRTPNLLLSPHQSSWAHETGGRVSGAAADAIIDMSEGRRPQWVVDPAVFDSKNLRAELKS